MANSIQKDIQGPDWPLGSIVVAAAGTPVNIMNVVDPTNLFAPGTPVTEANPRQYAARCNQIIFQGFKSNAGNGLIPNTGNIYIMRTLVGAGSGNRTDTGSMVACIAPGQTFVLEAPPINGNVFSPHRYLIDADNNNDAAQVTLIIA
jgi:hypothetical protein